MAEFSNPNQQGGQDNRSLVAMMVVFIAVLFGAQYYHSKMNPEPAPSPASPAAAPQAPRSCLPRPHPQRRHAPAAAAGKPAAPAAPVVQAGAETTTVIENELYRITFSNRGAQVTSWILKHFYVDSDGKPLDLVNQQAAKLFGYPLSFYTYDGAAHRFGRRRANPASATAGRWVSRLPSVDGRHGDCRTGRRSKLST